MDLLRRLYYTATGGADSERGGDVPDVFGSFDLTTPVRHRLRFEGAVDEYPDVRDREKLTLFQWSFCKDAPRREMLTYERFDAMVRERLEGNGRTEGDGRKGGNDRRGGNGTTEGNNKSTLAVPENMQQRGMTISRDATYTAYRSIVDPSSPVQVEEAIEYLRATHAPRTRFDSVDRVYERRANGLEGREGREGGGERDVDRGLQMQMD
jgi:hypothetical protein